jgi:asparagine synthase (glutamine-hydrolysing)
MCGIAGAVVKLSDDSGNRSAIRQRIADCVARISNGLRHRGPDGSGLWASNSGDVVFAHRRLAILDLSEAGAQPMIDPASGCVLAFNGEIYNFMELRRELEAFGERFVSTSDTEVILKAYRQWGLDIVPRLRGIFAMAIWDPRIRSVHLIRDQLGIKPLYWTIVRNGSLGKETLLFGSEVRALLMSGVVDRRLDPVAMASYLAQGFVVGPHTIVEGVRLLPAASILTISVDDSLAEAVQRGPKCYWMPPSSNVRRTTEQEVREELRNTVKMQLVSDAPLGIFLSGGIDSSAVATLASEVAPDSVHTFTIGFEEAGLDESRYAAQVAAAIKSRHTNVTLTEKEFIRQLPDAMSSIDQPTFDAINTYFVSRAAREAGMTVALAGTGGDEIFGGYRSFVELPKMMAGTAWIPGRALDRAILGAASAIGNVSWNLLGRAMPQTRWGKIADVARAAHDLVGLYQVSYALFTGETQERLASAAVREAQSKQDFGLPKEVANQWRATANGSEILHAISLLEMSSFVGQRLLRDTDAASMAVSLEVRVPLLDHVLYEKVAGIDPARRFLPSRKKKMLRDMALGRLDPTLFDRPKSGFVLPIDNWARRSLQSEMEHMFTDAVLIRRVGLCVETVRTLWRSYLAGKSGLHWSRAWSLYVLLVWCKSHDMALAA